ncbi:MAG TPA: hypothetical protein VN578_22645 [Candidatus Binatia bacterium]|nr:hypothetical protein [Candidatus Binatia bacterium]
MTSDPGNKGALSPRFCLCPERAPEASRPELCLNVLVLYQDAQTRQWAGEVCERVAGLISHDAVRTTWWKMRDLSQPAVLAGAVSTAMRADIIFTAIHAAEGFPLAFYVWVDSWLPHRPQGTGALVALIGLPERMLPQMDRGRDYLRAVARKGRLDFLIEERRLLPVAPVPSPNSSKSKPPRVSTASATLVTQPWPLADRACASEA